MSVEGLWTVRFASLAGDKILNESGGVITLYAGRLFGGDSWSYYTGSYELNERNVTMRVDVGIHMVEGGESILGGPLVPYALVGNAEVSADERSIMGSVHVQGNENAKLVAILTKVMDLQ